MKQSSKTINLTKLASDRENLVQSMVRELEGPKRDELASDGRWPTRFISVGGKHAPTRWGNRFLAAGPKSAPTRE